MRDKRKTHPEASSTRLFDRLAVSYLSGVAAFMTGILVWGALAGFNALGRYAPPLPFGFVVLFTIAVGILGFFLKENLVLTVLAKLWRFLGMMWR